MTRYRTIIVLYCSALHKLALGKKAFVRDNKPLR